MIAVHDWSDGTAKPRGVDVGSSIPLILVGCNVCYFVTQYAAQPMGIFASASTPAPPVAAP